MAQNRPGFRTSGAPLAVGYDMRSDYFWALEAGAISVPDVRFVYFGRLRLRFDPRTETILGFEVRRFSEFDPMKGDEAALFCSPPFDVPQIGLTGARVAEIIDAFQAELGFRNG